MTNGSLAACAEASADSGASRAAACSARRSIGVGIAAPNSFGSSAGVQCRPTLRGLSMQLYRCTPQRLHAAVMCQCSNE